jgi:hypothetical protein
MGKTKGEKSEEPPSKKEIKVIGVSEPVRIENKIFIARIDTGAGKSSICTTLLKKLNKYENRGKIGIRSAHGRSIRKRIKLEIILAGKKVSAHFTIADRQHMQHDVLIGRNILKKGFMIDPTK